MSAALQSLSTVSKAIRDWAVARTGGGRGGGGGVSWPVTYLSAKRLLSMSVSEKKLPLRINCTEKDCSDL